MKKEIKLGLLRAKPQRLDVIVEGCDNSGKTTLISKLAKRYDLKIVKSPGPHQHEELKNWVLSQTNNQIRATKGVVWDRFPIISETVYGPIVREGSHFSAEETADLWVYMLKKIRPILIYCRPPTDKIIKTIKAREQMEGVVTCIERLVNAYDLVMTRTFHPDLVYDYTKDRKAHILFDELEMIMTKKGRIN